MHLDRPGSLPRRTIAQILPPSSNVLELLGRNLLLVELLSLVEKAIILKPIVASSLRTIFIPQFFHLNIIVVILSHKHWLLYNFHWLILMQGSLPFSHLGCTKVLPLVLSALFTWLMLDDL